MTYELDPETGLIKLPTGYVWQLRRDRVSICEVIPAGDWLRCDHWMCGSSRETRLIGDRTGEEKSQIGRWIFKRDVSKETTREVKECRYAEWYREFTTVYTKKTGDYYYAPVGSQSIKVYEYETLTADMIPKFTDKCYRKFVKKTAGEKAASDSAKIYGVYPPKKLEEI